MTGGVLYIRHTVPYAEELNGQGQAVVSGIAPESLIAERELPSTRLASSRDLRWRTVLAETYELAAEVETFNGGATPDLLVVLNLTGPFTLETKRGGRWHRAAYLPGAAAVKAPGVRPTFRWREEPSEQRRSLHLFLSAGLLADLCDELGWPSLVHRLPDCSLLEDAIVSTLGRGLERALDERTDALQADALAHAMALHLFVRYGQSAALRVAPEPPRAALRVAVAHVIDHMHERFADDVTLDELAAVACVSKFHFVRLFKQAVGITPHQFLIGLRMQRAAHLLRAETIPVQQIARRCGYASPAQFSRTFTRRFGQTPSAFRDAHAGSRR